ncbi:hypothetical protein ABT404_14900 [Streptomyces hyaluromycini]|uniref:Uncharacterized protein n=1 Tax=Streptomyces hyaluromycini TaxID=1377993 RepID=A0ABV1WVH1_9ACTN
MVTTPSAVPDATQNFAEIGRLDLSFCGPGLPLASDRRGMELFAAEALPAVHALSDDVVPA